MTHFGVVNLVMSISTQLYSYPQETCTALQGQRDAQLMKASPVELYNWHHHSCDDFTGLKESTLTNYTLHWQWKYCMDMHS